MRANETPDPRQTSRIAIDPTAAVLKEQWINAVRRLESREAQFADRLESRQAKAKLQADKFVSLIERRDSEHEEDRGRIRQALEVSNQDLNAAHRTASRLCGEIGVRYVPGRTTDDDVLRVAEMPESEAARKLDLKHGVRLHADSGNVLKWLSAALCAFVSSVAWGALLCGLNLKRPLSEPPKLVLALLLGAATSVIVWRFLSRLWHTIGAKDGTGRPGDEVAKARAAAIAQTAVVLVGLITLDALGLIRANAAKAELNPIFAIPLWLALLGATFISFAYVGGAAHGSYADGYNQAAETSVRGAIASDINAKQGKRKGEVLIQGALDSLGQVKVIEQRIEDYKRDLKQLEREFAQALSEQMDSIPQIPSDFTLEEEAELTALRDRAAIAKERYDAHTSSRSVNYRIETDRELED